MKETQSKVAKVFSAELEGVEAHVIEVEVDLHVGLHAFNIVGLADKALSEAKERVNSALKNTGVKPPNRENRKITINLAPADIKKTGSHYDLSIAIGYLLATGQLQSFDNRNTLFAGELSLGGVLRPIHGVLNMAEAARNAGIRRFFTPYENACEASAIREIEVVPVHTLKEAIAILEKKVSPAPFPSPSQKVVLPDIPDFADIKGQENVKRALTVAAAGGHNLLMVGPPGVGKSFLACALPSILPAPTLSEAIEVTKIWSAAGLSPRTLIKQRPFRAPHQTASLAAIIGGGTHPRPGEISLAHRGVLFLDEFLEFPKHILEALRAPLESGEVHVSRARGTLTFPANFALISAMNPCPCGFYGDARRECQCAAHEILRYQKKLSGPLLDRIDLQVYVPRVALEDLRSRHARGETSENIKRVVECARNTQKQRFNPISPKVITNAEMSAVHTERFVTLDSSAETFLKTIANSHLSPRGYYRTLKVARTIADIENKERVCAAHLAEAFGFRLRKLE